MAVIGAGPGGIAAGVKLKQADVTDFVILERADEIGGSWNENHYPGLEVDIPSIAYQYSFARNPNWSRLFAPGAEVKQYHMEVARRFGLYPHVRFGVNVLSEEWDERNHRWNLHIEGGKVITARFVVSAVGAFITPKQDPGIAGLADYRGKMQRPSEWDHDYDLTGKRVAIIGTGASSVQITPSIAGEVGSLSVFQRTPVWCIPKPNPRIPEAVKLVLRTPGLQAATHGVVLVAVDVLLRAMSNAPMSVVEPTMRTVDAAAIAGYRGLLRMMVRDPRTRAALTPDYGPIAKRPTANTGYLLSFNRDNVELVTTPIERFTENGIRTTDGTEREFDMIVLATGYHVFSDPETYTPGMVVGQDGMDLGKFYAENGLQAYESVSLPSLPNRWTLVGPYSWSGSGWHAFVEMTADHAVRAISEARRRGATFVAVRQDAHDAYHRDIYRHGAAMRFYLAELNAHVPTYYRNSQGDSTYIRPSGFFRARRGHRRFPFSDYRFELRRPQAPAASTAGETGAVAGGS
ncbi:NAD(P)/FAD-dependent oxidoreductase [Nocardia sp. NBC_01503]|uniref:flavin-containing monooxygenase n=1 Tax=Nocardia sp. NBC_01503 TaxID=2975997 RepID=UPI002E7C14B5|nr:NAD(P)/FAD-dependent oxidoreductase [Nocardia sp. NBC_01503]WTL31969.1 NAD(P)/FAD-dependent oxidoreductase [Nocardia sp. NBC_01503]